MRPRALGFGRQSPKSRRRIRLPESPEIEKGRWWSVVTTLIWNLTTPGNSRRHVLRRSRHVTVVVEAEEANIAAGR